MIISIIILPSGISTHEVISCDHASHLRVCVVVCLPKKPLACGAG